VQGKKEKKYKNCGLLSISEDLAGEQENSFATKA